MYILKDSENISVQTHFQFSVALSEINNIFYTFIAFQQMESRKLWKGAPLHLSFSFFFFVCSLKKKK